MDEDRIRTLALGQHGLVTRQQILILGGTDGLIARRLRSGQWRPSRRGVVVVGAAPHTWAQDVMAASLAAGPDIVAAERTALRLWEFVPRSGRIQLLGERTRRVALAGVEVSTTTSLPVVDRGVVAGIPVTSVARTLVDNAGGAIPVRRRSMGRRCHAPVRPGPGRPSPLR